MPQTQSAKKALRQNVRRRAHNLQRHEAMKTVIKDYRKLIAQQKFEEAEKKLPQVFKTLDKLAKVNFIERNTVNRLKSRLSKKIPSKK